jgi:predicted dehydrogenase
MNPTVPVLLSICSLAACAAFARGADDAPAPAPAAAPAAKVIRAGIIGLDTSHAPAFTDLFNDPKAAPDVSGIRVVAAFPGGSEDLPSSQDRVAGYTKDLRDKGVEIVDSIPALLAKVDVVLLESVDGRKHLEQARPVFEAGKPAFIDKPLAASLADAVAIAELAKRHNVAWFSASSLRFSSGILGMRGGANPAVGDVLGCAAWSPSPTDPTHPDLFWYGIHGVETLFTIMGPGCVSVTRVNAPDADVVTGTWTDGRLGTFRGIRGKGAADYGALVFGAKGIAPSGGFGGYQPLVVEIARFFKTGKAPVSPEETLEIIAFMEAAEESKRQGGKPVTIEDVMARAREAAAAAVGPAGGAK